MKLGILTPDQLADLTNYVLGLPHCNEKQIIRNVIPVFVVKVWSINEERNPVERWCDCQLMQAGILPKPHAGRWHPEIPKCLRAWVGVVGEAKAKGAGSR